MSSKLTVAGAAMALAIGAASPASALTTTFNFSGNGGNLGTSELFTSPDGVETTVYAVEVVDDDNSSTNQDVFQSSSGLGVNGSPGDGIDEQVSDDGNSEEALIFEFDTKVRFDSVRIGLNFDNDDSAWFATNDAGVLNSNGIGIAALEAFAETSILSFDDAPDFRSLAGLGGGFFHYLVTYTGAGNHPNNDYTVKKLKVTAIPVPLGLPLVASAFALAYLVRRRAA